MQLFVTPPPSQVHPFKVNHADLCHYIDRRQAVLLFPIPEDCRFGKQLHPFEHQLSFEEADGKIIEGKGIKAIRRLRRPVNQFLAQVAFKAFGQMKIQQEESGSQQQRDSQHIPYNFLRLPHKTAI